MPLEATGIESPAAVATDHCEPPDMGPGPLEGEQVPLIESHLSSLLSPTLFWSGDKEIKAVVRTDQCNAQLSFWCKC